jgi:hypothetical protein
MDRMLNNPLPSAKGREGNLGTLRPQADDNMEAADESKRRCGAPLTLKSVVTRAGATSGTVSK